MNLIKNFTKKFKINANKLPKENKDRIVDPKIIDRTSTYSGNLTPAKLLSIMRSGDQGHVKELYDLYMEMEERDGHIASTLQTRKMAVSGLDWMIKPVSEETQDIDIADFTSEVLKNMKDFDNAIESLLNAIGYGFAVSEIVWAISPQSNITIDGIYKVRQQKFTFANSFEPRLLTEKNPLYGEELPLDKFIVHISRAKSGLTNREGVMRTVSFLYMLKSFSLKDWSIFSEIYGMPVRIGKYPLSAVDTEINTLKEAVALLGTDASAVIPDAALIEFVETKRGEGTVYERILEYIDRQISKAILGQTLTTDIPDKGTYAAAKVHENVRGDLVNDDAKSLAKSIRWQLIAPLVFFNYGPDVNIPIFKFDLEVKPDLLKESEKDERLFTKIKLPVATDYLYDKYGVPKPEEEDELLKISESTGVPQEQIEDEEFKQKPNKPGKKRLSVYECKDYMDAKYLKGAKESAKIFSEWLADIEKELRNKSGFKGALNLIENTKFDIDRISNFANVFHRYLIESFHFGRSSVNPNIEPLRFADSHDPIPSFQLVPENMVNFLRVQAFTVSHITNQNALESIQNSLSNAVEAGTAYTDFMRDFNSILEKTGVTPIKPFHLETVYIQNGTNAYQAGKFQELNTPEMKKIFPMWEYVTIGDDFVRPNHAAMHGHKAKADDPIWQTWYPPNGFRCRCDVEVITAREIEINKIKPDKRVPVNPKTGQTVMADKGFRESPAKIGTSFTNWVDSKTSWNKMHEKYDLPNWKRRKAYSIEKSDTLESETELTLQFADEKWGIMRNGIPVISYLKKFKDLKEKKSFYIKAETVNNITKSVTEIAHPEMERIGVPIGITKEI